VASIPEFGKCRGFSFNDDVRTLSRYMGSCSTLQLEKYTMAEAKEAGKNQRSLAPYFMQTQKKMSLFFLQWL